MSGFTNYTAPYGRGPITKTMTFSNTTGTVNVFTVTGDVIIRIIPVCSTTCASAGGCNISVGISGNTDAILPVTDLTALAAREIWNDISPTSEIESFRDSERDYIITDGNDVVATLSAQADSGVLEFYAFWTGLSSGASVIPA